jgi:HlyD family secretion protein
VARLSSSDVAEKTREIEAVKGSYEARARIGRAADSAGDSAEFESRADAADAALRVNRAVEAALVLRTPVGGTVLTRRPQDLVGSTVRSGSRFLTIGDTSSIRVEIPVTERLLDSMRQGEPVSLSVVAQPFRTYRANLSKISSAAESFSDSASADAAIRPGEKPGRFMAIVRIDNSDGSLAPGMAGTAKLQGRRTPYAVQWWRIFYNWVRRIIW